MKEFRNKTAVVTGGGMGIGRAIAQALAGEGMNLVIADVDVDAGESVTKELAATGVKAIFVPTDVSEAGEVDNLAARSFDEFGEVHLLCNNAGVFVGGAVVDTLPSDQAWLMAVNFTGTVNGINAFVPRMLAQADTDRHILNTASCTGLFPTPGQGAYAASKYAVVGYSERLCEELEPQGIGVSMLCPAGVSTRIGESQRVRPERFGGPVDMPPRPSSSDPLPPGMLDAREVARMTVRGIRENRLYIHTHLNWKDFYQQRFDRIMADFDLLEA
jgi:NAD(P)-dependent dehydrogenase (short-subunit alcohol dehydrogenase family)